MVSKVGRLNGRKKRTQVARINLETNTLHLLVILGRLFTLLTLYCVSSYTLLQAFCHITIISSARQKPTYTCLEKPMYISFQPWVH